MQRVIQGKGRVGTIPQILESRGSLGFFLVTGSRFQAVQFISEAKKFYHYRRTGPVNVMTDVERAYQSFLDSGFSAIVAVGGGSAIDLAKAVIHRCIENGITVSFFIAAPTTIGSGSEATQFAVVYDKGMKLSLSHPALLPNIAILDPELVMSLDSRQAAASGMDTLAQAVESYWSKASNDNSRILAVSAISTWRTHFLRAVEGNEYSRDCMQKGAYNAGAAINITRTTGPHALSYYLTYHHHIDHGQAVSLFLPLFFLYNKVGPELCKILGVASVEEAFELIRATMKEAGLATEFHQLGLSVQELAGPVLDEVNMERFQNNPVEFNREELERLIKTFL